MRSQQHDEEDDYRTQQWGYLGRRNGIAGKESHACATSARRDARRDDGLP